MTKSEFISLLNTPSSISEENVKSLKELTKSFPYCQSAYVLLAKASHDSDSMHANQMLKKAAAYSTHRDILKKVINIKSTAKDIPSVKTNITIEKPEIEVTPTQAPTIIAANKEKVVIEKKTIQKENSETLSIADQIQKTLSDSNKIEKKIISEIKTDIDSSKEDEVIKSAPSIKIKEEKKTPEPISKEKQKTESEPSSIEKKKEIIPEVEKKKTLVEIESIKIEEKTIGYHIYSSRLGNVMESENEYTNEYPFLITENNYHISAPEIKSQFDIVEDFIKKLPGLKKAKKGHKAIKIENLAEKSIRKKKTPATETLAKLYASQGNKKKAIKIYKDLILKNTEKRSYFASLIEQIEK